MRVKIKNFLGCVLLGLVLAVLGLLVLRVAFKVSLKNSGGRSIAAVAGKSGGHIVPAISLLQKAGGNIFFSTSGDLDKKIVELYPFIDKYVKLSVSAVPAIKEFWRWPGFIFRFTASFIRSLKELYSGKVSKVISTGGVVALPVVLAAKILGIEVDLYALDAEPGKAAMWIARVANRIYVCFEDAKKYFGDKTKVELVKYPIRFSEKDKLSKLSACEKLGIDSSKRVLLVLGGSQGSKFINDLMVEFAEWINQNSTAIASASNSKDIAIIHQAGAGDLASLINAYKAAGIEAKVFNYMGNLEICYSACDLCIARAGAGTLFELEFFCKRAIIIPLEADTTSHQVMNAKAMVKTDKNFSFELQGDVEREKEKFFEMVLSEL